MRSALDVVRYIDQQYDYWLERPEMYAANPGEMEAVFVALETIREFVIRSDVKHVGPGTIGYTRYSRKHGLGATALFTTRNQKGKWSSPCADPKEFEPLCAFLKGYLGSKYRARLDDEANDEPN